MSLPSEHPHEPDASQVASDEPVVLDGGLESSPEESTSLPIPSGPLRSQFGDSRSEAKRPSFWKRIKMRTRAAATVADANVADMAVRLDAIEQTVEHFDTTLQSQLDALNTRLDGVWEAEEQLSHLVDIQDKLDRLASAQSKQMKAIEVLGRTQGWLAALVVIAALSIGFAAGQFL